MFALGIFESCLRRGRNDREEGTKWRLIEYGGSFKILATLPYDPSVLDYEVAQKWADGQVTKALY